VLVELEPPPQRLFDDSAPADCRTNHLRFRTEPSPMIALAAQVKCSGEEFVGDQREPSLLDAQPDEEFAPRAPAR
jgi:glucose-6-phosphate 1-dehydrogenase